MGWFVWSKARGALWAVLFALFVIWLPAKTAGAQASYTVSSSEAARICAKDHLIGYDKDYGPDDVDHTNWWGIVMKDGNNVDAITFAKMKYRLAHCPNANDAPQQTNQNSKDEPGPSQSTLAALYNRRVNSPVDADQPNSAAPVANAADEATEPAAGSSTTYAADDRATRRNDDGKVRADSRRDQTTAPARQAEDTVSADTNSALPQGTSGPTPRRAEPMDDISPLLLVVVIYVGAICSAAQLLLYVSSYARLSGWSNKMRAKDRKPSFNVHGEIGEDAEIAFVRFNNFYRAVVAAAGFLSFYAVTEPDEMVDIITLVGTGASVLVGLGWFLWGAGSLWRWQYLEGMSMQFLEADNGEFYRLLQRKPDGDFLYDPTTREQLLMQERERLKLQNNATGIAMAFFFGGLALLAFLQYAMNKVEYGLQASTVIFAGYAFVAMPYIIRVFWVGMALQRKDQYVIGARVKMPRPKRKTRADMMAQGSHGKARFATAAEAARMGA